MSINQTKAVQIFNENVAEQSLTVQASSARAVQEIQAALVIAKKFPRDEVAAIAKIKTACQRRELAESAEYEYSRGGTTITGPTIDLLKAIAKRWGNIDYGRQELERNNGESVVRAFAWDMETNTRSQVEFHVRHWRDKKGGEGYAVAEERDIYELVANSAARRLRACLESVIDSDVIDLAVDECRKTLRSGHSKPLIDRIREMVSAFAEFGVTQAMIEGRIQSKAEACSENQLAGLRRIYKSLRDGVGKADDFFKTIGESTKPIFPQATPSITQEPAALPQKNAPGESNPPPAPSAKPVNFLRAINGLMKSGNVKESELLAFMRGAGLVDDSLTSLEEIAMISPSALEYVHEKWAMVDKDIKAQREAK